MGKLWGMLKLGTKLGLAGGTVFVSTQYGIWGNPDDASTAVFRLKSDICQSEYLKTVKENEYVKAIPQVEIPKELLDVIPKELPALPDTQHICTSARHHWNSGVVLFFGGLADLPSTVGSYAAEAYHYVSKQLEVESKAVEVKSDKPTKPESK